MASALSYISVIVLLLLITITLILQSTAIFVLALSPSLDHQQALSGLKNLIPIKPSHIDSIGIHDGRRFYLNEPINQSLCQMNNLPSISSVSYISDGRILNATFWLQSARFNDTFSKYPFQNASQIHQQLLRIEVEPSEYRTTSEAIINENKSLQRENFADLKTLQSTPIGVNNQVYKLEFTGKFKPHFGDFSIKLLDVVMVENKKLYRIQYMAEPDQYASMLNTMNEIMNSFQISKKPMGMANSSSNSLVAYANLKNDGKVVVDNTSTPEIHELNDYINDHLDIHMKYPSLWKMVENYNTTAQSITFFSPVKGAYFLADAYSISIDIPSYYETHPDYIARYQWSDSQMKNNNNNNNNNGWSMTVEELSSSGHGRIFYTKPDNNELKGERYVVFPVDLRELNYPNQYNLMFSTDVIFAKDGYFCHLVSSTNQVSVPPPIFYIMPSSNVTNLGPRLTSDSFSAKTVELTLKSLSNMYSLASLLTPYDRSILGSATLDPTILNVPEYGSVTTQLTIKPKYDLFSGKPSTTITLPILATINFTTSIPYYPFSVDGESDNAISIESSKHTQQVVRSGLTVTILGTSDYILYILNTWVSPLNVFITLVAGIIGLAAGLARRKQKQL
jgi:hypothetical protein